MRLVVHALFLGLSLLFATRFFSLAHPGSHAMTNGDPALMCWTLQWVSHALVHDPLHLYAGNTFYPYPHAVILSDPMVSLAVLNLPVRLITSNPWVGYNLLIVAAYYFSCVWGAALIRALVRSEIAAVWGGLFWGFLFYRVHQIGHLQILSFQFIPAVVLTLIRFWDRPGVRTALWCALAFVAQALVGWYLAVITAAVVAIVTLGQAGAAVSWRRLLKDARYYLLIAGVSAAAILPFALPYQQGFSDSTLAVRRALVDEFGDAVSWRDYLTPPVSTLAGHLIPHNRYWIWGENTLYIGWVPLILAGIALVVVARRRAAIDRRWVATGLALVAGGYVLALGFVSPSLGVPLPLHYLARLVPPLAGLRATERFSLVLYAGVLILSSIGVAAVVRAWRPRWQVAALVVAGTVFLAEVFPVNLPIGASHEYRLSAPDRVIAELQRTRPQPLVVLHLPIHYFTETYPISEATYMVDSTAHWARILNGFSGAVPDGFMRSMGLLTGLPSDKALRELFRVGVDVIAVHRGAAPPGDPILVDFFSQQPWATVTRLPGDECVVVIDRARTPLMSGGD
jgi:hypothetical protein